MTLTETLGSNTHPVLLPLSTQPLEVSDVHVAPPVAAMSLMAQKLTLTVPDALDNVARVPAELL